MDVSLALAFAAGLLSFVSPCVLALVPVYLAFLGETAAVTAGGSRPEASRGPVLFQAVLFVAGFSALFIVLGVSAGLLGRYLFRADEARIVAGLVVIAIGLLTAFSSILDRWRIGLDPDILPGGRSARSLGLGALVAVGWTPCIGPVLGTILTMGASAQQAGAAALLLTAYSAGLAVPFLAAAVALPRVRPLLAALRRHARAVQLVSGAFIVLVGALIVTNAFSVMAGWFTFFI
ncbi:MAG TPA: cytochrome c biogenesis protein CcdA [candidate division Zixibacteria bacterium]|nr:cytochrome c biogenesis protein CcdA [candidate division Zixibacteria bacterium]